MSSHLLVNLRSSDEGILRMSFIENWLKTQGIPVQTESIVTEDFDLARNLEEQMKTAHSLRISHALAETAFEAISNRKTAASIVHQQVDALIKSEGGSWWPRCYGAAALIDLIQMTSGQVDNRGTGMVVGENSFARVALYVLAQLGFRKLNVISMDLDSTKKVVQRFQQRNFGVNVELIHASQITLQFSNATVLINTLKEEQNPEIIQELCYFNYLEPNGLVVDLYPEIHDNSLIKEANEVGMRAISGSDLQGRIDFHWLKELYPQISGSWDSYLSDWARHWDKLRSGEVEPS